MTAPTPRHPLALPGHPGHAEAAEAIGDLRYDALAALLGALSAKLEADAVADEARGRPRLAALLREAAGGADAAAAAAARAWDLCAPHMRET